MPRGAPLGHSWLGEGELVVLYREADMPDAPPRVELARLAGRPFITLAASGPLGRAFTTELERLGVEMDEVFARSVVSISASQALDSFLYASAHICQ